MKRRPPLNTLHCFDVAARLCSFVQAAKALHLTHGAVSRQIRLLEESLGTALFERRNRAVFLTPSGERLHGVTQQIFEQLDHTLNELQHCSDNAPLVVSCEPTITMKWLIPRLGDFERHHPDIPLHIYAAGGQVDFGSQQIDVALRRNDFYWGQSIHAERVCDEWIGPVCVPGLVKRNRIDLAAQRLFHTSRRPSAWKDWSSIAGIPIEARSNQTFEYFHLSLQAACAGLGVAIASAFMVQDELASRRLVAPFGFVRDSSAYYLLSSDTSGSNWRRVAFAKWSVEKMLETLRELTLDSL